MEVACRADTAMPPSPVIDVDIGVVADRPLPESPMAAGLACSTLEPSDSLTEISSNDSYLFVSKPYELPSSFFCSIFNSSFSSSVLIPS